MADNAGDRLEMALGLVSGVIGRLGTAEAKADVALSAIGLILGIIASGRPDPTAQLDRMLAGMSRILADDGGSVAALPSDDPWRVVVLAKTAAVEQLRRSAEAALADFSQGGALDPERR